MASKAELRTHFKELRGALPEPDRQRWSRQVCAHLGAFCAERGIQRVGSFACYGSEVDLGGLEAARPELELYFPRVTGKNPPRLHWGTRPLEPGTWGLLEPREAPHAAPPVQLLLVPGLAFAADGQRLGYGRGFYDAVLAGLDPSVITLAAGFEAQRCAALPAEARDRPVQGIVTEAGIAWF